MGRFSLVGRVRDFTQKLTWQSSMYSPLTRTDSVKEWDLRSWVGCVTALEQLALQVQSIISAPRPPYR